MRADGQLHGTVATPGILAWACRQFRSTAGQEMHKKTIEIHKCVSKALKSQPDYSLAFTGRVNALAKRVQDELAVPVEHDSDMNYSSAQKIIVWLDKTRKLTDPRSNDAIYRLEVFVSSKGPFFAFATLRLVSSNHDGKTQRPAKLEACWMAVAESEIPKTVNRLRERIASIMVSEGYTHLDGALLSERAKGAMTQLDRKPATVFEVLFSEL